MCADDTIPDVIFNRQSQVGRASRPPPRHWLLDDESLGDSAVGSDVLKDLRPREVRLGLCDSHTSAEQNEQSHCMDLTASSARRSCGGH